MSSGWKSGPAGRQARNSIRSWRAPWLGATVVMLALAGCGGGSGGSSPVPTVTASATPTALPTQVPTQTPTATPTAVPVAATNASIFAVDCETQRAYVPLPLLANGQGQVAVLDLSVDPAQKDPRIGVVNLGISGALPRAAAADPVDGEVLITNDNGVTTGILQVLQESNDSLTNYPFPAGSRPRTSDSIVYDTKTGTALLSMSDAIVGCSGVPGTCTGAAVFNLAQKQFTSTVITGQQIDGFGYDGPANLSVAASVAISPDMVGLNLTPPAAACQFADSNIVGLDEVPDTAAVDPSTGIWVVGNLGSAMASVVNLNGSSFTAPPNCTLNEGGTQPNSVNFDTQTNSLMAGVGINPLTHQALMSANLSNQVALLTLPPRPVTQIASGMVSGVSGSVPNDPLGVPFIAATYPYAVVVDTCHNYGYILDELDNFLVQINLETFQSNPASIATALPTGSCAGTTSTTFSCDNGAGVKFFPLPDVE